MRTSDNNNSRGDVPQQQGQQGQQGQQRHPLAATPPGMESYASVVRMSDMNGAPEFLYERFYEDDGPDTNDGDGGDDDDDDDGVEVNEKFDKKWPPLVFKLPFTRRPTRRAYWEVYMLAGLVASTFLDAAVNPRPDVGAWVSSISDIIQEIRYVRAQMISNLESLVLSMTSDVSGYNATNNGNTELDTRMQVFSIILNNAGLVNRVPMAILTAIWSHAIYMLQYKNVFCPIVYPRCLTLSVFETILTDTFQTTLFACPEVSTLSQDFKSEAFDMMHRFINKWRAATERDDSSEQLFADPTSHMSPDRPIQLKRDFMREYQIVSDEQILSGKQSDVLLTEILPANMADMFYNNTMQDKYPDEYYQFAVAFSIACERKVASSGVILTG